MIRVSRDRTGAMVEIAGGGSGGGGDGCLEGGVEVDSGSRVGLDLWTRSHSELRALSLGRKPSMHKWVGVAGIAQTLSGARGIITCIRTKPSASWPSYLGLGAYR